MLPATTARRARPAVHIRAWAWVLIGVLVVVGLGLGGGAVYSCRTPLDLVQGTQRLPDVASPVIRDNRVLFTVHRVWAEALDFGSCSPTASGLQWIKAAAHASDPASTARILAGLEAEADRSPSKAQLAGELCGYLRPGSAIVRQRQLLAQAGLPCPG